MNISRNFVITAVAGLLVAAMPFVRIDAAAFTAQEQANIKVVADFYAALEERGAAGGESKRPIRPIAEKYLSAGYKQMGQDYENEPGGRERLIKTMEFTGGGPPAGAPADMLQPAKVLYIAAVGDLVTRVSTRGRTSIWNMFRVRDGLLYEHWAGSGGPDMGGRQAGAGAPPGGTGGPPAGAVPQRGR